MSSKEQISLDLPFQTSRPANPLFCHQEFLEKLAEHEKDPIAKRAALLMQRLSVDSQRQHYKATQGLNRGWRRSRLGGGGGSHFYAWWAPKSAAPLKDGDEFANAPDGALFLRDIRHHDDHSTLNPQSFENNYLPITIPEIRSEEYGPAPWTAPQAKFANARQSIRILKGHPGSGKTTALWHAADATGAARVLYVTYSRDLAALAKDYFDKYCSAEKRFHVVTYSTLVRELLGSDAPIVPEIESRQLFTRDLVPFSRVLNAWSTFQPALYDELHAHLIGDALPMDAGRYFACKQPRLPDKAFKDRRSRYIGIPAAAAALDIASRLERDRGSLAPRYFPELALAWKAAERLTSMPTAPVSIPADLLAYDCIAVDEVQDLTPIEAFVLVQLAVAINKGRRTPIPLLLAGDEAQTVRPTDFEWAWMNDLLHSQLGSPTEYKLSTNLRSPRKIAELLNRVWDLYGLIDKQERPSGSGQAEIDDDANDQLLYCVGVPGQEMDQLLMSLAGREGLAIISLDDNIPAYVPDSVRPAVLTAREAKGLDFHSVCVLEPGRQIDRLHKARNYYTGCDIGELRKRLAIDQLRVALSRPTERLIWLDTSPSEAVLKESNKLLNGSHLVFERNVSHCVPSSLLKTLEEDQLDLEERIQRCQQDARQYLSIRPEMAWSRGQQAVSLLGNEGNQSAVTDPAARAAANLTLAEVCFALAFRKAKLPAELGLVNLFFDAQHAAAKAKRFGLATLLSVIGEMEASPPSERLHHLIQLAKLFPQNNGDLEPWFYIEIAPAVSGWVDELEASLRQSNNASALITVLPAFYEALDVPNRAARLDSVQNRAIQLFMKEERFADALAGLRTLPKKQIKLEAACHEGLKDYEQAAALYREAGSLKEALQCYRSIPDATAALALIEEMGDHPAGDSLRWIARLENLVEERPENFNRMVLPAEKKQLEQLLERSLGVARKKPVKAVGKKAALPKKKAPAMKKKPNNFY